MAWFSSKVRVTLIDDATGESFGVTELPPADLPESFQRNTTLHLGGEDWSVVAAQPKTRPEYAKSKTLTLQLRRIEMLDPSNILYSLPSICSAIPGLSDQRLAGTEFVLAEDDWRQLELVSNSLVRDVDDEIEKIRRIHDNATTESGWSGIHVRSTPELPIACTVDLADLANALDVSDGPLGIAYHGGQSPITDGYALRTTDLTVYGVATNGKVKTIALDQHSVVLRTSESMVRLKSLAQNLNLDLVHWCRCARVGAGDPQFDSLLVSDSQ